MTARDKALWRLGTGDIFNAEDVDGPGGPVRTCLVIDVTTTTIRARAMTTQEIFAFDRRTGIAEQGHVVTSTAPG